ncbi:MAG: c-type cytochrome [Myxococcales bacterium]|nr:c-type cytochrome [Myxococcales bacterium]
MKLTRKDFGIFFLALIAFLAAVVVSGLIPIRASSGHWALTSWFLNFAKRRSVATHSFGIHAPPLDDPRLVLIGAGHFETGCRYCHGAPGEPLPDIAAGMTPHPPRLEERVPTYDDAELFTIVLHGIKFTGMPAWPAVSREDEVWAMVSFLSRYPELRTEEYRALVDGASTGSPSAAPSVVRDVCARCHGADGLGRSRAFPVLAGQSEPYLRASLDAYRTRQRASGIMEPIASRLSDDEADDAARWYAGLDGGLSAPVQTKDLEAEPGREIASRGIPSRRIPICDACHGGSGFQQEASFPRLHGQSLDYLESQLRLFAEGERGGTRYASLMRVVASHHLSPDEIRAVAEYYAAHEAR